MQAAPYPKLNPMQLHLLKLFDRELSPEQEAEVKQLLADYFFKLADEEADRVVAERNYSGEDFDAILKSHRRTPSRSAK